MRSAADVFETWNRKLHFYIGLLLLWFLWLFAFTGLLLNHPKWTFAEFWPQRKETRFERTIQAPPAGGDLVQARDILRQLGLDGEIEWTRTRKDPSQFEFRASRVGHVFEIKADLARNHAAVQRIDVNGWGMLHILHTYTGVRLGDKRNQRDWIWTTVLAYSMDALAIGLIVLSLGSYYMWWKLRRKRFLGAIALAAGWAVCLVFAIGLRMMF